MCVIPIATYDTMMTSFQKTLFGNKDLLLYVAETCETEGPGVNHFGNKDFGVAKLKLPISQLLKQKITTYCNCSPSFFNSGHKLNNPTLLIQLTMDTTLLLEDVYNKVIGSKGSKIVFS